MIESEEIDGGIFVHYSEILTDSTRFRAPEVSEMVDFLCEEKPREGFTHWAARGSPVGVGDPGAVGDSEDSESGDAYRSEPTIVFDHDEFDHDDFGRDEERPGK